MVADWEIAVRLLISGILAGIIGYERQARHKSAGLRTYILVCVGSCLIMIISQGVFGAVQGLTNADPGRIAAQVVSGIGFLGAGAIIREGPTIKGLTTAAGIWVVAGVGLAVGGGFYFSALVTTVIVFLTLTMLARWEKRAGKFQAGLMVTMVNGPGQVGRIDELLARQGVGIQDMMVENDGHRLSLELMLNLPPAVNLPELLAAIAALPGVTGVKSN